MKAFFYSHLQNGDLRSKGDKEKRGTKTENKGRENVETAVHIKTKGQGQPKEGGVYEERSM